MPKIKYHLSDLMRNTFSHAQHPQWVKIKKFFNIFTTMSDLFNMESNRSAIREPMIFLNHLGYFFYFFAYCVCSLVFIFMGILFWGKVFNPTFFFCKKKKIKNCSYNSISTFFTIYKKKLWASKRTDVVVHDAFWKIYQENILSWGIQSPIQNKVDLFIFFKNIYIFWYHTRSTKSWNTLNLYQFS